MHGLQPLPPNFHSFPPPLQKGWIWSGPIGVWIMKGLPGAGRGPVIPRTRGLGFWVGFGWVPLLRDACTHVSLWQPLPKSKARHRRCMYYINVQYRTWTQRLYYCRNASLHTTGAHALYISICITLIFCIYHFSCIYHSMYFSQCLLLWMDSSLPDVSNNWEQHKHEIQMKASLNALSSSSYFLPVDVGVARLNLRSRKLAYHLAKWLANVWASPWGGSP